MDAEPVPTCGLLKANIMVPTNGGHEGRLGQGKGERWTERRHQQANAKGWRRQQSAEWIEHNLSESNIFDDEDWTIHEKLHKTLRASVTLSWEPSGTVAVLVLPGVFSPVHREYLQALEDARSYIESQPDTGPTVSVLCTVLPYADASAIVRLGQESHKVMPLHKRAKDVRLP